MTACGTAGWPPGPWWPPPSEASPPEAPPPEVTALPGVLPGVGEGIGLDLGVLVEPLRAELPPEARLLEPAEGTGEVPAEAVDPDGAGPEAAGDGMSPVGISPEDAAVESVDGVVGDPDGVVVAVVVDDGDDGTEDLLLGDP